MKVSNSDRSDLTLLDNYGRRTSGSIVSVNREPKTEVKKSEVGLLYLDGSCVVDHGIDIVDVADSLGAEEYCYAKAIYSGGVLDRDVVVGPSSNDLWR